MIISMLENGKVVKIACDEPKFDYTCNVLCVGAGSAGVYAADSAAREGADVILCEIGENIGGMHVCGNVTGYYYGARGGSYEEDDEKTRQDTAFSARCNWEQRQVRLTERLQKSGVRILCRHSVIGLYMEENRVIGVLSFDGEGEVSIGADITIDATSDGHLIRMTDVKKRYGRPEDGSYVPFTVRLQYTKGNGGIMSINTDSGIMDHYDSKDFSKKTVLAHANACSLLEKEEVLNCALHVGVREGLTYEGESELNCTDLLHMRTPEKVLFWAYSDLDRHGSQRATEEEIFQNWWVVANLSTVLISIPVPMGSIVPKNIKGLVTAGRCISCDTYTQSAVRMNKDMFRMGECVGVAAALASLNGVDFLDIDYDAFLSRVRDRGCFEGYSERTFGFDDTYGRYLAKMKSLKRNPDKKYEKLAPLDYIYEPITFDVQKSFHLLKTDAPGIAIWSCFLSPEKDKVRERLYSEMTNADDKMYKYNCAITLGLLEDTRALPVLCDIVRNRDCFFFTDNRRSNQFRSAVAVCLIGRLGTEKELPMLLDILSPEEIEREMYNTLEANYLYHAVPDRNFVYFAMLTHTCMALYKIYKRNNMDMAKLHEFFDEYFKDGSAMHRVTDAAPGESAYEEMKILIQYILKATA